VEKQDSADAQRNITIQGDSARVDARLVAR
jgi:hypothetical protein